MVQTNWVGKAPPVAQVTTVTVGGTLAGEDFEISVGGELIASHTDADTVIATTVAALVAAWNASTSPYATQVSAADASPDIVLTSDVGGMPFVITLNTPGGSATFAQAATTASAGPNHWDDATNWDTGVPSSSDLIIVDDPSARILWGLPDGDTIDALVRLLNFQVIGLRSTDFATSADGTSFVSTRVEYRDEWLKLAFAQCTVGRQHGTATAAAIGRLKLWQEAASPNGWLKIFDVGNGPADANLPAVRLRTDDDVSLDLTVIGGLGGVGIGVDATGQLCDLGDVRVIGADARVFLSYEFAGVGDTTFFDSWIQEDGVCNIILQSGVTPLPLIVANGGIMTLDVEVGITQLDVNNGASVIDHSIAASGDEITTVNIQNGGVLNMTGSRAAKTYGTVNMEKGATLVRNDLLTITTENLPANQDYTVELT